MAERKEITLEEYEKLQSQPGGALADVQVSGIVTIKDKDGKVKSRLKLINLDTNEET